MTNQHPWHDQETNNIQEARWRMYQVTIGTVCLWPSAKYGLAQFTPWSTPSVWCWLLSFLVGYHLMIFGLRALRISWLELFWPFGRHQ